LITDLAVTFYNKPFSDVLYQNYKLYCIRKRCETLPELQLHVLTKKSTYVVWNTNSCK